MHAKPVCSYVLTLLAVVPGMAAAYEPADAAAKDCTGGQRYTFSWNLQGDCAPAPRGGTSTGTPVTLDPEPHPGWVRLQDKNLTDKERDRAAILAMAGPYRAGFEFLETIGYTPGFKADRPYQSWGTEYIYVLEDRPDFISLQHIMVMFFVMDGKVNGPMVMKHWRQDWQYEKRDILAYAGNNTWRREALTLEQARGTWAQAVWQVDDSPRYESYGRWEHKPNFSTWRSALTWRPLPRREHTVRDDYEVLEGYNIHTIVPTGWVQEEENYKVKLDDAGHPEGNRPYLSKELGVNRYERIKGFDFSAGDRYWEKTGHFWRIVREEWQRIIDEHASFRLRENVEEVPLYASLFDYAARLEQGELRSEESAMREFVSKTLQQYLVE
jgi:hypothetical protein